VDEKGLHVQFGGLVLDFSDSEELEGNLLTLAVEDIRTQYTVSHIISGFKLTWKVFAGSKQMMMILPIGVVPEEPLGPAMQIGILVEADCPPYGKRQDDEEIVCRFHHRTLVWGRQWGIEADMESRLPKARSLKTQKWCIS
jgi:hypothetical protein